jgi:hypothetical protein
MKRFEDLAKELYKDSKLLKKAVDAGILIDNRLKKEYTKGGTTNCFFDVSNWLKYFDK